MIQRILSILLLSGIGLSCNNMNKTNEEPLDLSGRDTTVSPAENFFEYANGDWIKKTEIPASKTGWGSFYVVRDQALENMRHILEDLKDQDHPEEGSLEQQVGDLYVSALDTQAIEKNGIQPLQGVLEEIENLKNKDDVLHFIATQYVNGDGYLFSFYIAPDDKDSNKNRPQFMQGGLGLPNKMYYFKEDDKSIEIRNAYLDYIADILGKTSGEEDKDFSEEARKILVLETRLAEVSKTPVELRDPEANYHLLSLEEISEIAPQLDWGNLLKGLKVDEDTLLVGQPDFYKGLSAFLEETDMADWKAYLTFHLVNGYASWLSEPFADAHFDFYNKKLNGQEEPEERWKRASSLVNGLLGDALGQLYVKKYFPPEAKEYMLNLVGNLQKAYGKKIQENAWMSDSTKQMALEKLDAIAKKIGYPDKWKDYSDIEINRSSLVDNLQNISRWHYDYDLKKLDQPVDKDEWFMTPPTVNAYYNPSFNEIVFPAGILQPPFYFKDGDDAVNYGGIGFVIGHEMTHGFDDQGSQFDKEGNLKNWWTKTDREKYEKIAQKVVAQYSAFTVEDSVHVNGELTLGENMADIGGLAIAYDAFKMTEQGKSDEEIDGLTPDQRFFMSCAQVWRIKTRPERMLWRINNDPHSPEMFRVNGPLSNMKSFYTAFDVQPDDTMYRSDEDRIEIW